MVMFVPRDKTEIHLRIIAFSLQDALSLLHYECEVPDGAGQAH